MPDALHCYAASWRKIALALGGRPGARMTRLLAAEVPRTTLLRLVPALPSSPSLGRNLGDDLARHTDGMSEWA
jgi:hypothetical protein